MTCDCLTNKERESQIRERTNALNQSPKKIFNILCKHFRLFFGGIMSAFSKFAPMLNIKSPFYKSPWRKWFFIPESYNADRSRYKITFINFEWIFPVLSI